MAVYVLTNISIHEISISDNDTPVARFDVRYLRNIHL